MTESTRDLDVVNAMKIGGGGAEPDAAERLSDDRPEPDRTGAGVDLKSSELPD